MFRSIGKQSRESVKSVQKKKRKATWEEFAEKEGLSLEWKREGVMDNESGELMELMEEVPLKELGEAELERLVFVWWREAGSWFQRPG